MKNMTIYVDDLLLISQNLRIGSRWRDGTLHWCRETEIEDLEKGRDNEEVTLQVYLDAANEIIDCLKFTGEVSRDGRPIPCLDVQLWAGHQEAEGEWFSSSGRKESEKIPGL